MRDNFMDIAGYVLTGLCGIVSVGYGIWLTAYAVLEIRDNI